MEQSHLHEIMSRFNPDLLEHEVERLTIRIDDLETRRQTALDVLAKKTVENACNNIS